VLFDTPAVIVREILENRLDGQECVVIVIDRNEDKVVAKSNNIACSIASYICNITKVIFGPPSCIVSEILNSEEY
jgi:hypothetical protein